MRTARLQKNRAKNKYTTFEQLFGQAMDCRRTGETGRAVKILQSLTDRRPTLYQPPLVLAYTLLRIKEYSLATEYFAVAAGRGSTRAEAWLQGETGSGNSHPSDLMNVGSVNYPKFISYPAVVWRGCVISLHLNKHKNELK
jgi:hypothetical protein